MTAAVCRLRHFIFEQALKFTSLNAVVYTTLTYNLAATFPPEQQLFPPNAN
jgi:hypothetical protein